MTVETKPQEFKLNRLETTKLIGPWVDRHWGELRTAKERGEKVGWCSGPLFIFAYAMRMKFHFMAGYAAYCAGRKAADEVLEAAELYGELRDTCSYHRLHTGMAAAIKGAVPQKVREDVILPIPDIMISGRLCVEMSHYAEALYRRFGIPVVGIDLPQARSHEEIPRIEAYVERQVKEVLIPALEKVCGRPFDYDHMRELLANLKEVATIRNKCWQYFNHKPSPWTLWDYGVSMAPLMYLIGQPETVPYYKKLLTELKERAKSNIGAIYPQEKYRLYWDGWLPWGFLGMWIRKLVPYGAVPICGRYPWEMFPYPERIDLEQDPVRTFVQMNYSYGMAGHGSLEGGGPFVEEIISQYPVDGLVMASSRTCRMWNLGQQDIVDRIERKFGIPGVIIEQDNVDSQFINEAQIDLRLRALFEMIDGRRK